MKELCLIIPTHNRADCIEEYLERQCASAAELGVDLILWDTSTDGKTEAIANDYRARGYSNVHYDRYDGPTDRLAIDRKVVAACRKYGEQYPYLWFSSDGTIIDLPAVFPKLKEELEKGYVLIGLGHEACPPAQRTEYTDCAALFRDCGWWLTSLTSTVYSSKLLRRAMDVLPLDSPDFRGLWLPMSVFYTIADAPFQMLYLPQAHFWTVNPRRSDSFWKVSGNALRQWGEVWCETIDALPAVYDSDKAAVLKSFDAHIHLFSVRQLVNMKPEGNLSLEKVRRYRPYIDRVTDTPVFWFYFVSIFVNRSLAGDARAIYRKIKKLKTTGA